MTAVPHGARTWLAGLLCALAVCASLLTLAGPIAPGGWLPAAAAAVLALAALLAGVRAVTSAWWAPTLVGLVATALGILAVFASPPGRFQALPNTDSLARLGDVIRTGLTYADVSRPPVEANRPLELLVVGGALLVLLIADLVALGLAAPAWSGLPLLALWLPGIAIGRESSLWAFIGTCTAYLLLLALTSAPAPASRGTKGRNDGATRTAMALGGVGTVMVAAIALTPLAGAAPGWSSVRFPKVGSDSARSMQLAQDLDLRESLGTRSNEVVMTYSAEPVTVGPLRVFTLRDFDGENWSTDDRSQNIAVDDSLLWPARDLANRPRNEVEPVVSTVTVRIEGLREEQLPVPVMPRTLDASGRWSYDAERDEVDRVGVTRTGLVYSMQVNVLDITAANLRETPTTYPSDMDEYLAVPRTSQAGDIEATAVQVTEAASGTYEKALALQSYFRDAQTFTYDTDVPGARSDDAVWDFLGSKTGYCVQFATAMTVMARTLGIPARLGVGFLPGALDENGNHVVTGRDSHAWPELYFPNAGWIRFEPTPAIQSGAPPRWADPFAQAAGAPTVERNPVGPSGQATAAPSTAPNTSQTTQEQGPPVAILLGVGGSVVLVLIIGALWLVRRRRLVRAGELDPEIAWAHLRTRLGSAGISWSDARTPRQVTGLIAAELEHRRGVPMHEDALGALNLLSHAVQDDRYSPRPQPWESGQLEAAVILVLREINSPASVSSPASVAPDSR